MTRPAIGPYAIRLGPLRLDPLAIGSQGNAVLGIRDSGKTYTATLLAERLFGAGIPFTAFDPVGVWRFLRVPGAGRGYPVVVAGGMDGDLPLTPSGAPAIVEAAMQNGVSLVLDFFSMELSKADWRRIVRDCVRLMLHRNKPHGLRHVFLEEAAEFAPQKVYDGEVYAEIEKLARMGGNCRLGYTLINQRAEEVNKAVLELCDNLFLHRQKGKNSLLSLRKWLDAGDVQDGRAVVNTLSTLPTGECWAWMEGQGHAVRVKVPAKNSLHPDRRIMRGGEGAAPARAVDVSAFVAQMRGALAGVEEEAKKNDPKELRKEVSRLRGELQKAQAERPAPEPEVKVEKVSILTEEDRIFLKGITQDLAEAANAQAHAAEKVDGFAGRLFNLAAAASPPPPPRLYREAKPASVLHTKAVSQKAPPVTSGFPNSPEAADGLQPRHAEILRALKEYQAMGEAVVSTSRIAVYCGLKAGTGHTNNLLSRLSGGGYIERSGGLLRLTGAGSEAAGEVKGWRSHGDLMAMWAAKLQPRHMEALRFVCARGEATNEEVGEELGLAPGTGHFNNLLSRLSGLGLIERSGGRVRASAMLWPEGRR